MNRSEPGRRSRRGGGALEFAVAAPLLLGFLLAIIDLGRFLVAGQLAASAATAVAELASQTEQFTGEMDPANVVTGREVAVLALAAREVARPTDLTANGAIIVTVMRNRGSGPEMRWQRRWGIAGVASEVGPTRMRGVVVPPGDSAVYVEVSSRFEPWLLSGRLLGLDGRLQVRSVAVRRPRLGGPELLA